MKKEIINLLRAVLLCIIFCVIIAAIVALLLRTPLWGGVKAYLFRLLALTAIACAVLLVVAIPIVVRRGMLFHLPLSSVVMCIGLSTLFMALFLSIGIMPIERSYTIYSLADMADSDQEIYTSEEIKTQFIVGYIEEANESQKRIDEQVHIGNLEETPEGYKITHAGKRLIKLYRILETIFPVPDEMCIYPHGK